MRFRSPAEARGLRLAGHERKGRRDGRPINNPERGRQGHGDFDCPSPRERCRTGRAMKRKRSSKPRNPASASALSPSGAQDSSLPHKCGVPKLAGTPHLCGRGSPSKEFVVRPSRSDDGGKSSRADKIRILIADHHTTVLAGLASIIGMQPDMLVVAEAANGRQAVDLWLKQRPDVTLLDLRMPMLDGVGVIDEIRKEDTSARIIMLTTYDTDNEIYRAIKAGVKGHLRNIFTKLNVLSRTEAITVASRRGLVQL